jgi:uncharacterized protein (TIGR02145 family)
MKTKIFRKNNIVVETRRATSLLAALLLYPIVLPAQNGVTVSNLIIDAGTVTFNVSWDRNSEVLKDNKFVWLDSVWVFVDYNDKGTMKRLPLSAGATLTATSAPGVGRVKEEPGNDSGVWVIGNAKTASSGSFSATVKLLTATANLAGACAYASNYPPVGKYTATTKILFTGTPMYKIVLKEITDGSTFTAYSDGSYTIPAGHTVQSFTDATGAPGIITPMAFTLNASAASYCPGLSEISFSLSGTQCDVTYQLIKNNAEIVANLNGTGSAATFSGTYMSGMYSAKSLPTAVFREVAMNGARTIVNIPSPTITLLSGDTNQSIAHGKAIAAIKYTTANATGAAVSGLPSGVSGAWSSNTFTISGSISSTAVVQTYHYTITTTNGNGCTNASSVGTITVACDAPGVTGITFAEFSPCIGASYGSTYTLTDARDQKTYKVKYMPDGRYWMVQDLQFGDKCVNKTSYHTVESDYVDNISSSGTYYGDCIVSCNSSTKFLYDWAAAVNQPGAYDGSAVYKGCTGIGANANSCQGICPAGWHVPTADEFTNAHASFANYYNCKDAACWSPDSEWSGTIGAFNDPPESWRCYYNNAIIYWSSTPHGDAQRAYSCCFYDGWYSGTKDAIRHRARNVRCIMNY